MKKILVTGAGGQLGREIAAAVTQSAATQSAVTHPTVTQSTVTQSAVTQSAATRPSPEPANYIFATRTDLPIEDPARVASFFATHRPDICINCAAYTAVDKAESEKDLAFRVNGDAVGSLAAVCRSVGALLFHISTDYVFDGNSATPLKEDDPTDPINIYGASKLKGEQLALQQHPEGTLIIRTSWVYSEFGNNFVKTMIRLMHEKPSVNVVDDQFGSPTYAADLAAALLHIVDNKKFVPGVFHYSNEGRISWYEFALAIRELTGSSCPVNPIPTEAFPTPAKRPKFSLLDKNLIRKTYGLRMEDWKTSLADCIARLA